MPKPSLLQVKETQSELSTLLRMQKNPKNVIRIQSLICIKENRFESRVELASSLGYHVRTMELWLKEYRDHGLESMLIPVKQKQKRRRKVSAEIHQGLQQRLTTQDTGFSSYVEAKKWVEDTYDTKIEYNTLRTYMIDFFGTKIKRPRKSHVKKSEEATAEFLKDCPI